MYALSKRLKLPQTGAMACVESLMFNPLNRKQKVCARVRLSGGIIYVRGGVPSNRSAIRRRLFVRITKRSLGYPIRAGRGGCRLSRIKGYPEIIRLSSEYNNTTSTYFIIHAPTASGAGNEKTCARFDNPLSDRLNG
ncbi:hypothetical protein EVAR_53932_1 [Eumeta japonica]|uniref:Uncharacterized protein n=1 Tax=Eumeta variegata TaxID=151549 RepID=A0A4C1YML6_EUMVA|nr:hypothetical protein EVAR_53932_1 [Eumeta japonica]